MNRALFRGFPIRWRVARFFRDRAARRSMAEFRQRDPSQRPINAHRVWLFVCVIVASLFLWLGEGIAYRKQQALPGLYSPSGPTPRTTLDCSPEGREVCKARTRMGKVKQL